GRPPPLPTSTTQRYGASDPGGSPSAPVRDAPSPSPPLLSPPLLSPPLLSPPLLSPPLPSPPLPSPPLPGAAPRAASGATMARLSSRCWTSMARGSRTAVRL